MDKVNISTDIILVSNKELCRLDNRIFEELWESLSKGQDILLTGIEDGSASVNRNFGISKVKSDIFIMIDDDIEGFYKGWVDDLIRPFYDDRVNIVSARLINRDGSIGSMMGDNKIYKSGVYDARKSSYRGYVRVPTAALAIRKQVALPFDEGFIGSGYEDTDWFNRVNEKFPGGRVMINNDCKLIHHNVQKNQGGKYFEHNKEYYMKLYPDDNTAKNQRDWTKKNENR
jgi:glycosyltransferase involved in cell wall biosynthesis